MLGYTPERFYCPDMLQILIECRGPTDFHLNVTPAYDNAHSHYRKISRPAESKVQLAILCDTHVHINYELRPTSSGIKTIVIMVKEWTLL